MKTVLLVTNVPTPYRLPLFNEIARQLSEAGLRLKVLFGASRYARREWRVDWGSVIFEHEVLGGRAVNLGSPEAYTFLYPGLLGRIQRERPAAVIVGGFGLATLLLRVSKFRTGAPFIIWSGETRQQRWARSMYRRWLIRGASSFIAYGSSAKRYLLSLGADPSRVAIALNTVDTGYFGSQYGARGGEPQQTRHQLISISGLFERKQMDSLIRVAEGLSRKRDDFEVLIIGSGPERAKLEALARELNVSDIVRFLGFLQREEVAARLRSASCFLFPTSFDIWGLVLVEAMAAGVPCISSVHAGATEDLIEDGRTGYAIDFADIEGVCARIEKILDDPEHASKLGAAAHELVLNRASLQRSASGVIHAVQSVVAHQEMRRPAPS